MSPDRVWYSGFPVIDWNKHCLVVWPWHHERRRMVDFKLVWGPKCFGYEHSALCMQHDWNFPVHLCYWQTWPQVHNPENNAIDRNQLVCHSVWDVSDQPGELRDEQEWRIDRYCWCHVFPSDILLWHVFNTLDDQLRDLSPSRDWDSQFTVCIDQLANQCSCVWDLPTYDRD